MVDNAINAMYSLANNVRIERKVCSNNLANTNFTSALIYSKG